MPPANPSIQQLAGQRLMVGFDGTEFDDELRWLIGDLNVGGLVLFTPNIVSPEQITNLCRSAQRFAHGCRLPPLFIAIDQEGGRVARLGSPFTQFPGNPTITDAAQAYRFGEITAVELRRVGINMNFAPVLDVVPLNGVSVMNQRSFGRDPDWVAALGSCVIDALQQHGVMAVAKHFPGIGRTTLDSHLDLPALDTPWPQLASSDLVPFKAAVRCAVSGIMLSHIRYTDFDDEWPASLSEKIAAGLLRQQLSFRGLIFTDDLDMGAIKNHFVMDQVIDRIIAAEIDMVLICHKGPDIERAFKRLFHHIDRSVDTRSHAKLCLQRIWAMKHRYLQSQGIDGMDLK
jgi:beta-N-acetylhexosaminidase